MSVMIHSQRYFFIVSHEAQGNVALGSMLHTWMTGIAGAELHCDRRAPRHNRLLVYSPRLGERREARWAFPEDATECCRWSGVNRLYVNFDVICENGYPKIEADLLGTLFDGGYGMMRLATYRFMDYKVYEAIPRAITKTDGG